MLATIQLMHNRCAVMAEHAATQYLTAQHISLQHSTGKHGTAQHITSQHGAAQCSAAQRSTAQHRMTCYPIGSGALEHHLYCCTSMRSCVIGRSLLAWQIVQIT